MPKVLGKTSKNSLKFSLEDQAIYKSFKTIRRMIEAGEWVSAVRQIHYLAEKLDSQLSAMNGSLRRFASELIILAMDHLDDVPSDEDRAELSALISSVLVLRGFVEVQDILEPETYKLSTSGVRDKAGNIVDMLMAILRNQSKLRAEQVRTIFYSYWHELEAADVKEFVLRFKELDDQELLSVMRKGMPLRKVFNLILSHSAFYDFAFSSDGRDIFNSYYQSELKAAFSKYLDAHRDLRSSLREVGEEAQCALLNDDLNISMSPILEQYFLLLGQKPRFISSADFVHMVDRALSPEGIRASIDDKGFSPTSKMLLLDFYRENSVRLPRSQEEQLRKMGKQYLLKLMKKAAVREGYHSILRLQLAILNEGRSVIERLVMPHQSKDAMGKKIVLLRGSDAVRQPGDQLTEVLINTFYGITVSKMMKALKDSDLNRQWNDSLLGPLSLKLLSVVSDPDLGKDRVFMEDCLKTVREGTDKAICFQNARPPMASFTISPRTLFKDSAKVLKAAIVEAPKDSRVESQGADVDVTMVVAQSPRISPAAQITSITGSPQLHSQPSAMDVGGDEHEDITGSRTTPSCNRIPSGSHSSRVVRASSGIEEASDPPSDNQTRRVLGTRRNGKPSGSYVSTKEQNATVRKPGRRAPKSKPANIPQPPLTLTPEEQQRYYNGAIRDIGVHLSHFSMYLPPRGDKPERREPPLIAGFNKILANAATGNAPPANTLAELQSSLARAAKFTSERLASDVRAAIEKNRAERREALSQAEENPTTPAPSWLEVEVEPELTGAVENVGEALSDELVSTSSKRRKAAALESSSESEGEGELTSAPRCAKRAKRVEGEAVLAFRKPRRRKVAVIESDSEDEVEENSVSQPERLATHHRRELLLSTPSRQAREHGDEAASSGDKRRGSPSLVTEEQRSRSAFRRL